MAIKRERVVDGDTDQAFFLMVDTDHPDEPLVQTLQRTFGGPPAAATAAAVPKRLLTDIEAAEVLGISRTAVRSMVANGVIKRVQLPSVDGQAGRASRVLRVDLHDLEKLIERWKG